MMHNMAPGIMWEMGLSGLLAMVVLLLAAAALVKYLRASNKGGVECSCSPAVAVASGTIAQLSDV